jgi:DNA uptake protein ComE-like DNA-binding protein
MNGQKQQQKQAAAAAPKAPVVEDALKTEVTCLKKRIEEMNKNIDDLTSMVQKVTLAQATVPTQTQQQQEETVNQNNKRTKVEAPSAVELSPVPDESMSGIVKSSTPASMDLDDIPMPPSIPSPIRETERENSTNSELSDEVFVDQLFTAFGSGDFEFEDTDSVAPIEKPKKNQPRPELMNRLSDALALLPSDIQEMIVERLIQAITSPKEIQENIQAAKKINEIRKVGKMLPSAVPQSPKKEESSAEKPVNLNLAAATLAALLQHFGDDQKPTSAAHKALLIPVHA